MPSTALIYDICFLARQLPKIPISLLEPNSWVGPCSRCDTPVYDLRAEHFELLKIKCQHSRFAQVCKKPLIKLIRKKIFKI